MTGGVHLEKTFISHILFVGRGRWEGGIWTKAFIRKHAVYVVDAACFCFGLPMKCPDFYIKCWV